MDRSKLRIVLRMFAFLKPLKSAALFSCLLLTINILLEVAAVYFLSPIITNISQNFHSEHVGSFWNWLFGSSDSVVKLRNLLLLMIASQVSLSVMSYVRSVSDTKLSMRVISSIRANLYDHLQHLAFSFYDRMTTGKLMNRALVDIDQVHGFINMSLFSTLDIFVSVVAYMSLLAWRSPWLLVGALLPIPFWILITVKFSKRSGPLYQAQQVASDAMMVSLTENISGRQVVRAFGASEFEKLKFKNRNETFLDRLLAVVKWQACLNPALQGLAIGAHITVFIVCSYLIHKGILPVGDLMILGAAMATILSKLRTINQIAETSQRALVSGERLFEVLDAHPLRERADGVNSLKLPKGDIEFCDIDFGYNSNEPVLKHLWCKIPAGKITAIVGPTGAGKTTLSALLARFYDADKGQILIGGQNIKDVGIVELRRHVGFVFQETFLFSDTVRNNISYGRPDVSEEMLKRASIAAHADDFIQELPNGYDTLIGEGGVQLSGGQRQRLALARALVYDPEVLILDDALAALDATTASRVQDRLQEICRGRTVLFITHRPSTLALADNVLVMKEGKITSRSEPKDLFAAPLVVGHT